MVTYSLRTLYNPTGRPRPGLGQVDFLGSGIVSLRHIQQQTYERLTLKEASLEMSSPVHRYVEKMPAPTKGSSQWQQYHDILDSWVQQLLIHRMSIHKVIYSTPTLVLGGALLYNVQPFDSTWYRKRVLSTRPCCLSFTEPCPLLTKPYVHTATSLYL